MVLVVYVLLQGVSKPFHYRGPHLLFITSDPLTKYKIQATEVNNGRPVRSNVRHDLPVAYLYSLSVIGEVDANCEQVTRSVTSQLLIF